MESAVGQVNMQAIGGGITLHGCTTGNGVYALGRKHARWSADEARWQGGSAVDERDDSHKCGQAKSCTHDVDGASPDVSFALLLHAHYMCLRHELQ